MKIFIASDHGGFELKEFLKKGLEKGNQIEDLGCGNEKSCDYPEFAEKVANAVIESNGKALGILCCGTGIGMCMTANKIRGVRAAVVWDEFTAKTAKEHNNANILCLGGRSLDKGDALKLAGIFMRSKFEGETKAGERHVRRLKQMDEVAGRQELPEVTVGALIFNDKSQVFLMKSPKWDNLYSVPGGRVELGETRAEALKREVLEETGLEIFDEKLFTLHDAVFPKEFHKRKHFVMINYLAKPRKEDVNLDEKEGIEFVWMNPNLALKELKLVQYTRRALEDYVNIMNLAKVF